VANLDDRQAVPEPDIHPNVRGHKMIFGHLNARLRQQQAPGELQPPDYPGSQLLGVPIGLLRSEQERELATKSLI
jgi:hypothetical protein